MRIFKYLKKYWFWAILAPIFMIIEVMMDLRLVNLMAELVNRGVLSQNMEIIKDIAIKMVITLLIGISGGILCGVFTNLAAQNYGNDLRKDTFSHIVNLSYEQTDSFSTGSLVTRLTNDITQVQNMVQMSMRMFIRTFIQFAGGIWMLFNNVGSHFAVVLFIALPLILVAVIFFIVKVAPMFKIVQESVDGVNSVVQENVTGSRVVKAYVREAHECERFAEANNRLYKNNMKVSVTMAWLMPLITIVMAGSMIAVMYIGGSDIISNINEIIIQKDEYKGLQVGDIMASISYISMIISGFMMLAMMMQFMIRGIASIRRINEVLDTNPVINSGIIKKGLEVGTVEFKNVSFSYPKSEEGERVLQNISFKINKGETIGILGATGSGKTSLVNLITRFYDATEGEVFVDGINVKEYDLNVLRENIVTIVLQKAELFSGTIEDNIKWGKKDATQEEVIEASTIAQAHTFISGFENGYQTIVAEKGASLSGGQKQRISIARALIRKPEILIFDDSTSALDLTTEANLYYSLNKSMSDTTVIIIAQRVASVKNADKIMIINDGVVEAIAPHHELIKTNTTYQEIYNSQLKQDNDDNGETLKGGDI